MLGCLVFDFDLVLDVEFVEVVVVVKEMWQCFNDFGMESFCKIMGGKGFYVVVLLLYGVCDKVGWKEVKVFV